MAHIAEDRWREVFLLAASLLPKADIFFEHFLRRWTRWSSAMMCCWSSWRGSCAKADSVESSHKPVAVRRFYISLARASDRARYRPRARAIILALDRDHRPRSTSTARALDRRPRPSPSTSPSLSSSTAPLTSRARVLCSTSDLANMTATRPRMSTSPSTSPEPWVRIP